MDSTGLMRVLPLIVVLVACKSDKDDASNKPVAIPEGPPVIDVPRPASVPESSQRAFDEMMPVFDDYATAVMRAAGDCNQVGSAIRDVTAARGAVIGMWREKKLQLESDQAGKAWYDARYLAHVRGDYERIRPGLRPCLSSSAEIGYALA